MLQWICPFGKTAYTGGNYFSMAETPMNSELLKKIRQSGLTEEDARDIVRIFPTLTSVRQVAVLDDFAAIAERIQRSREKLEEERKLLWANTLDNSVFDLEAYMIRAVSDESQKALGALQSEQSPS